MIQGDRYCVDILLQLSAVISAFEDLVVENHLNTCVVDAMKSDDEQESNQKIEELKEVISKFRKQ